MKCGIYKIVNRENGKYYVGSSIDLSGRIARHKRELNNRTHPNPKLLRAWEKYGEESFDFQILYYCDEDETIEVEQEFLDFGFNNHPNMLYNIAKNSLAPGTGLPSTKKGKKLSEETRRKMSLARMGKPSPNKGNKYSKEIRDKMKRDRKGWSKGEENSQAKINQQTVDRIRMMFLSGKYSHREISEIIGISRNHVTNIINNKRWYSEEYEKLKSAK